MKVTTVFALAAALLSLPAFGAGRAGAAEGGSGGGEKILVAYFSWSGNTREIASQIHGRVGGDIFEIRTEKPYPADYRACTEAAQREQKSDARPALEAGVADMATYDVVFVAGPCWWGTIPMAVFTFLEGHDFAGKTLIPVVTHEGSGLGRSAEDIARLCPDAKILPGLAIRGSGVRSAQDEVSSWLRAIGMAK